MTKKSFIEAAERWHQATTDNYTDISSMLKVEGCPVEVAHNAVMCAICHIRFVADVCGKAADFDKKLPQFVAPSDDSRRVAEVKKYIISVLEFLINYESSLIKKLKAKR